MASAIAAAGLVTRAAPRATIAMAIVAASDADVVEPSSLTLNSKAESKEHPLHTSFAPN